MGGVQNTAGEEPRVLHELGRFALELTLWWPHRQPAAAAHAHRRRPPATAPLIPPPLVAPTPVRPRRLGNLAGPLWLQNSAQMALGLIAVGFVGHLGDPLALSQVGIARPARGGGRGGGGGGGGGGCPYRFWVHGRWPSGIQEITSKVT